MIVVRKTRGSKTILPEAEIKNICLHELLLQTIRKYAHMNFKSYPQVTNSPDLVVKFIAEHHDILANPYSEAQDKIVQSLASIINHENSLNIVRNNIELFTNVLNDFHNNLNYSVILDCTVFKTPNNYLNLNPSPLTTYFLIIQTKSIMSDVSLIKNFSKIKRKT